MNIARRAGVMLRSAALWAGVGIVVLACSVAALGFFAAALFIWLDHMLGAAAAAALTGIALLLLGLVIGLIGGETLRRLRARQPTISAEAASTLGLAMRLASMAIRRDPKKTLLGALLAGAAVEFFTSRFDKDS